MKNYFLFFSVLAIIFSSCSQNMSMVQFQTSHIEIGIDTKGYISEIVDLNNQKNYLASDTIAPLLSYKANGDIFYPVSASYENNILSLVFENKLEAKITVEEKPSHITFELKEFNSQEQVELIVWGPIPTTIKKIIGETIGVVRGNDYAIGIQALNIKTLGGFPWTDNDCMPQFDIFEQEDYSDLSEENKRETLYRVEAAKPEKFGSTLQA